MYPKHSYDPSISRRYCSLCGREIAVGDEYWLCNGTCICEDCLSTFAKQELHCCRETRGKEIPL